MDFIVIIAFCFLISLLKYNFEDRILDLKFEKLPLEKSFYFIDNILNIDIIRTFEAHLSFSRHTDVPR